MSVNARVVSVQGPDVYGDTLKTATSSGNTSITLEDVTDFEDEDGDGGWLVIGDSDPIAYVAADDDTNTVTLAGTVGAAYEAGLPVALWDPSVPPSGAKVIDYLVNVDTGHGVVPVTVKHEMIPLAGVDSLVGASVSIEEDEFGEWSVEQVYGREPYLDIVGPRIRTAETGTRVELAGPDAQPFGDFGMLSFYTDNPDWTPGIIWGTFDDVNGIGQLGIQGPRPTVGGISMQIAMSYDEASGQRTMALNAGEVTINGDIRIGGVSRAIHSVDFGVFTKTTNASSEVTITHSLAAPPDSVLATNDQSNARQFSVTGKAASNFTLKCFAGDGVALGAGVTVSGSWLALT